MKKSILILLLWFVSFSEIFADPGENTVLSVCLQEAPFSLTDGLLGTPDPGGVWQDPEGEDVLDGIFTPGVSTDGVYTYTVDAESATLTITSVNCAGGPPNDDCSSAQFVNPSNNVPFSTFGATTDGLPHFGAENCEVNGESQIESDVWYFYAPDCDGEATFSTVGGTQLNTKIAVYTFACPPSTNELIACNEDFGAGYQSAMTWEIQQGMVYLIRLGESPGPGSGNGTFNLTEVCDGEEPPENQLCTDAITIGPSPAISFSTFNAQTDGPSHAGDATCSIFGEPIIANDIWYSYTATCDGSATVSTLGSTTLDTRIAIYGESCPADLSSLIACNDDYQGFAQSEVSWEIITGETYTIRLGNNTLANGGAGTFSLTELCGQEPPSNDVCDSAIVITPAFGIPFNTIGAGTDGPSHFNSPICDFFGGPQIEKDVWYVYTASCDGTAEVSTVGGTFLDTRLAVYAEYCPSDLTNLIVCNDDDGSLQSTVEWNVVEGYTYYIRLGEFPGEGGGTGTFNLIETCQEVCTMPVIGYETVCNGLDDFDSFYVQATVVTIGNVGPYLLSPTQGGDSETVESPGIYLFGPFDNESVVLIVVESLADENCIDGSYELTANCYPDNFNFACNDIFEAFPNQYTSYTNEESFTWGDPLDTEVCGFNQVHNDLWYAFTAECDGEATWHNCALSTFNTRMAVYENTCENEDLELLACSEAETCGEFTASVTFPTVQGSTYVLRIGSTSEAESGIGVFIVEQEIDLVSAGTDTSLTFCSTFTGSIVLNQFIGDAESGGEWTDLDNSGGLLGNVLFFESLDNPGIYQYSYTVSGPCNTDSSVVTIVYDICESIAENDKADRYEIFPNPTSGNFNLRFKGDFEPLELVLIDLSGRVIDELLLQPNSSGVVSVPIRQDLSTGIYFVRLTGRYSNRIETQKLIVR